MKNAKAVLIAAIIISAVNLAMICCINIPALVPHHEGDMKMGPAHYSRETREVFDMTEKGVGRWAEIYEASPTAKSIKSIRVRTEIFKNGKWETLNTEAGFGGRWSRNSKVFVSFDPQSGGSFRSDSGESSISNCKKHINENDLTGSEFLTDTEAIKPGKKNVAAIYQYSNKDNMTTTSFGSPTKTYYHAGELSKHTTLIALTIEFSTKSI